MIQYPIIEFLSTHYDEKVFRECNRHIEKRFIVPECLSYSAYSGDCEIHAASFYVVSKGGISQLPLSEGD